jgi:hypothetical protein
MAEIFAFAMGFVFGADAVAWWVLRLMKKLEG